MKRIIILLMVFVSSIISCSIQGSLVTNGANYTNWVGGQEGIGGTNFVFKVISKTNDIVTLDSIYIDNVKVDRWEQNRIENSIIIKTSINYNNNKPNSIDSEEITAIKTDNKGSFNRAKLFFSTDKKSTTIVFDEIKKMDNNYYP